MYLLDTNVIWAFRNRDPQQVDEPLFDWAANQMPSALFASAISLIEFENGARQLERKNKAGAASIRNWIEMRFRPAFEKQMKQAAKDLEFEKAAALRDQVIELRRTMALEGDLG